MFPDASAGPALWATKFNGALKDVMPQTTPQIKVDAVKGMGAEVVLHGDSYGDAKAHCDTLVTQTGMTFIHPFDDPLVIAGQGTIGAEILRHSQDRLSAVFVPVGGGGLAAGVATFIKFMRPQTRVIGVEPADAASMAAETVVMMRQSARRMVPRARYVTTPGSRIQHLVSDLGVYGKDAQGLFELRQYFASPELATPANAITGLQEKCGWPLRTAPMLAAATPPDTEEMSLLRWLTSTA